MDLPSVGSHSSRGSSSGDGHPADSNVHILQKDLLKMLMGSITDIVQPAHRTSEEARPVMDKERKAEMREKAFASTLGTLQRAYSKLLHEAFAGEWTEDMKLTVRDLADGIVWKLSANAKMNNNKQVETGKILLERMLEHLQVEFTWEKTISVPEEADDVARNEKATAYSKAKLCLEQLKEIRRTIGED